MELSFGWLVSSSTVFMSQVCHLLMQLSLAMTRLRIIPGLIYSTRLDERGPIEVIEKIYPGMLEGLAGHEGIGFIMVQSEEYGPVVLGENGKYYLTEDRVEGENPLSLFGPNVVAHLKRTDSFPDAPDNLVNSFYDPEKN